MYFSELNLVSSSVSSLSDSPGPAILVTIFLLFPYFFCFEYDFDRNPLNLLHCTFKCVNYFKNYDLPRRVKSQKEATIIPNKKPQCHYGGTGQHRLIHI